MALVFIEADKYVNNQTYHVEYLANLQQDGYIYFNDDTFFRCRANGSDLQLFYIPKQIWTRCNNLNNIKATNADILRIIAGIFGGGVSAENANIEAAIVWMIDKVSNNYITYSQSNRNLKNPDGTSYDCSSFVITGFTVGGFNINATYTGDMRSGFTAAGFTWYPGSYWRSDQLVRGDILLNERLHTQVYIGNNQDVNCGSTPARIVTHSPDYWGRGWNGILRYTG